MYLLDTDILIWLTRSHPNAIKALEILKDKSACCLSTVTVAEIYKNIYASEIAYTDEIISNHPLLPLDAQSAKQAGLYWRDYYHKFQALSIPDCMIAATAKSHNLTLVTLNAKHFPMSDITVLNPAKS